VGEYGFLFLAAFFGYLLGSLNTSLLVGKIYETDIRKHGSGNAGMTNTLRTLGKTAAVLVTLGDALKAVAACLIGDALIGEFLGYPDMGLMIGGVFAILGHIWPVFFKFKGGKGILTSIATILMMNWQIGVILLIVFIIIVAITRYISLGSIIGSILFPTLSFVFMDYFETNNVFVFFAASIAVLAILKHKANISRLLKGNENKLGQKKIKNMAA
jgi:glycerol-3-phosphate acyltransferase PlsY